MTKAKPYVAFAAGSYWRSPTTGPAHAKSAEWIAWLEAKLTALDSPNHVSLATSPTWGVPIAWPKDGDPLYRVAPSLYGTPVDVRIPLTAHPSLGSDAALTIIDRGRDETISLWRATFASGRWYAAGTERYALSGPGLCGRVPTDFGHRGIPGPIRTIRRDELAGNLIAHRLELFVPGTADVALFPLCAAEPGRGGIIPEGALLRLKAAVDLSTLGLSPKALVIARALQTYGAVVGDNDPNLVVLKCDPTCGTLVFPDSLARLPWSVYEFAA